MKKYFLPSIICFVVFFQCGSPNKKAERIFNGKDLEGWDAYIASASDSIPPPGLNNDPQGIFSVVNEDGESALRVSGEVYGGLSTRQEYENYHLSLEFKWGKNKIPSFKDRKRDSGILYHAVGPHGVDARAWMRSQELQVQETDCGDYWGVAGAVFDIPAMKNEKGEFVYDPSSPLLTFRADNEVGRRCIKYPDAEKPSFEWNTIDLYCYGDSSVHVINGIVVMKLYRSRQVDNGQEKVLRKGKIQIQSEGCEVYYRNITLESINQLPAEL